MKKTVYQPLAHTAGLLRGSHASSLSAETVTSTFQVPLAGTVFVPLDDGSFDEVALTGRVQVTTQFFQPPPLFPSDLMRVKFSLDGVSGIGETGQRYTATGTNRIYYPTIPRNPMTLGFVLHHTAPPNSKAKIKDPPSGPIEISFRLTINPNTGVLTAVQVLSLSVPVP